MTQVNVQLLMIHMMEIEFVSHETQKRATSSEVALFTIFLLIFQSFLS